MTPMDQISAAFPETLPVAMVDSSGGINAGLPAVDVRASSPLTNISETPKSTILSVLLSDSNRLSGLISI